MKRILFITHESSRTGAPMVLLHFIKWLKQNQPAIVLDILSLKDGSMDEEFKMSMKNYYNYELIKKTKKKSRFNNLINKIKFNQKEKTIKYYIPDLFNNDYDLIYANTIVSIPVAIDIKAKLIKPI